VPVTSGRSYLADNRRKLRQSLILAARDLTVDRGWDGVRMIDVATAVGVSRQTVYNEFDSKVGLAEAVAAAEIERFVITVRKTLFDHGADIRAAATATIHAVVVEAAANPLVRAILTSAHDGGGFVPYLTTDAGLVLGAAGSVVREWAQTYLPDTDEHVVDVAADAIVRLTISHLMQPAGSPEDTAATLGEVFVRLMTR
jgi:AcrR family transcriptional regulator